MKNLTRMAILLAAVIGFMPAKPAQANPHHEHHNYGVTRYYEHKPTYRHVYRTEYYYPKKHSTYYYYPKKHSTYQYYYPKQHSTYRVYYYR